jgi:DNA-directed RNA polymerase specialized sigma24 family protein
MSAPLTRAAYAELLRSARRHARRADEAEDLLHDALAAALVEGRTLGGDARGWLAGVMRNTARMQARTALRRRKRETAWRDGAEDRAVLPEPAAALPAGLPSSLRVVLLLSLTGHSRAEIRHLLRLSDEALRQRIAVLRRKLAGAVNMPAEPRLAGALAFGSVRRALLPVARLGHFATHDPDGHCIVIGFSQRRAHGSAAGGN